MFHLLLSVTLVSSTSTQQIASDCAADGVDCVSSLSAQVNDQASSKENVAPTIDPTATAVFGLDLASCIQALENRNAGFQTFDSYLLKTQSDVFTLQSVLTEIENNANAILTTETGFSTTLIGVADLLQNGTERASKLLEWETAESAVRYQLRDLFNSLQKDILTDTETLLSMDKTLRNALNQMQVTSDQARKVLITVADQQANQYHWAYNVTSKVNLHNTRVVALAQEVQFRLDEVTNEQIVIESLHSLINDSKFPFLHAFHFQSILRMA